jgi:hypothetical protein
VKRTQDLEPDSKGGRHVFGASYLLGSGRLCQDCIRVEWMILAPLHSALTTVKSGLDSDPAMEG